MPKPLTTILGIDNGLDGGFVALEHDTLQAHIMPTLGTGKRSYDLGQIARLLRPYSNGASFAFLERAQAMPGQGVASMFSIGLGFGMWQGLLTGLQIPFEIVSPQKWQREMFVGISGDGTKVRSALVAQRLRPEFDWRASPRCRKPHDGLTDAFCLAEYGRRRIHHEEATKRGGSSDATLTV
jgi:crossover junction endodeoxyribonuclease RuvC